MKTLYWNILLNPVYQEYFGVSSARELGVNEQREEPVNQSLFYLAPFLYLNASYRPRAEAARLKRRLKYFYTSLHPASKLSDREEIFGLFKEAGEAIFERVESVLDKLGPTLMNVPLLCGLSCKYDQWFDASG